MRDTRTQSATELAAAIRHKEIGSRELLDSFVDRIGRLNSTVNAVVTLDVDRASHAADAADAAISRGELIGPLHGLPITIKDAIATEGLRSTAGAVELSDHVPDHDAPAVSRLKAAGAIVFGKTNVPRWSRDLQSFNEVFGQTNNPWDVTRVPGGSSGGAAAAVAVGFTSFELGTDIGGSIRIPSHFCGVFGLKPSYGVIPQRGYLDRPNGGTTDVDMNVFGPIARSGEDLDLLLGVLAGPEPKYATAWRLDLPPARWTDLSDYRIGVWLDEPACPLSKDYRAVLCETVDRIADLGAKIEEARPPIDFGEQIALYSALGNAATAQDAPEEPPRVFGISHLEWLQHDRERRRLSESWSEWFHSFDVLLCPVAPSAALPHDHTDWRSRTMTIDGIERGYYENVWWAGLIGVVGFPSAVPPIGRTPAGLPVGVQCITPFLHDRDAIRVAMLISEVTGGYSPPSNSEYLDAGHELTA